MRPWFVIDPAHFEIHPTACQRVKALLQGKDSLENKVAKELIRTIFGRPVQRLYSDDLRGNAAYDIPPLLDFPLQITATGNNDYNDEISRPWVELRLQ